MRLTENFELEEFVISQVAIRNGIQNEPRNSVIKNLRILCEKVLQPMRFMIQKPIIISSCYRSELQNTIIGGATNSQHIRGEAADIYVPGIQACELFALILKSEIKFDQLILEFNSWVHVSYSAKRNRKKVLIAKRFNNKVVYEKVFGT
ncbi:MAG: DUF882 domain-containing protein [Ignavibacteriales bacterium]|nr:DUF882 domain-containing protein [Ignavibacteriales bacterium]